MIYTSYFRSPYLKNFIGRKVAISVGVPPNWKGQRFLDLAPTREMLKMSIADYNKRYDAILALLDPVDVAERLEGCVLICWEKDPLKCHRSYVAKWLENIGIEVKELTGDSLAVGQQDSIL